MCSVMARGTRSGTNRLRLTIAMTFILCFSSARIQNRPCRLATVCHLKMDDEDPESLLASRRAVDYGPRSLSYVSVKMIF